ncbi:hypothetical protein [Knoellia sp. p5-6-4]|uniref:hypothetical protein n=1 Tax=unclassified Knoellia TaxID=2618719 RepID=UPI0023DAB523|nr:hypothetical protein [Knoellia sp. p5-6-4]MDF2144802.1 hypothetical protein [Knoellia sp. p5-6-4]
MAPGPWRTAPCKGGAIWGYVLAGKITYKCNGADETFEAGEAYDVPPGHTPVLYAGTEVVGLSTTDELPRPLDVVSKNLAPPAEVPAGHRDLGPCAHLRSAPSVQE